MKTIRIIARPPGEAPEYVRDAWIGLELPLSGWLFRGRRLYATAGVLSGPRTWAQRLRALLLGGVQWRSGYAVKALRAVAILETRNPAAAAWWRTNCPHLLRSTRAFVFPTEVCREC